MISKNTPAIDTSDLPMDVPNNIRTFVSMVREGYSTQQGSFKHWKKAITEIVSNSPAMHFILCVAVGATMRPLIPTMPGGILHLRGLSTTGKSIALQTVLSLRADPSDMTWCFDMMSTVKWYTVAAENNYLCLDDVHMAILPENGACKPMSPSFFNQFEELNSPHVTIISSSVPGISTLNGHAFIGGVEIDSREFPLWPTPHGGSPWWMDQWIQTLKLNYGQCRDKILDSLSNQSEMWLDIYDREMKKMPSKLSPAQQAIFVQAEMGRIWLNTALELGIEKNVVADKLKSTLRSKS